MYDAIMKAANHIEKNPGIFEYSISNIPRCGSPGCALGWIGYFAGEPAGKQVERVAEMLNVEEIEFYRRMTAFRISWMSRPSVAAEALRLYAEKYHGHEKKPTGIPDSIRELFDVVTA